MNAHNKCRNLNTMRTIRITLKVLSALKNFKAFCIFSGYMLGVVPFIVASNTQVA